jgi:hypothetical protein
MYVSHLVLLNISNDKRSSTHVITDITHTKRMSISCTLLLLTLLTIALLLLTTHINYLTTLTT